MNTERKMAKNMRINALEAVSKAGASHIGAVLSVTDIVATLYADVMKYDANNPKSATRDVFILSKGHAGCALYCALAEVGFFPKSDLENYYTYGSLLSGHVSHKVPGVEVTTGALGHGLGIGVGFAYSFKLDKKSNRVFVVVGDGECNEGSIWESVMLAVQLKLDNLFIIVDRNNMQAMGRCEDIIDMGDLAKKFAAFGCNTIEVNGHDHEQLKEAFKIKRDNRPIVVIANTIKGKGVSFMESNILWHYRNPSAEDLKKAIAEIEASHA